MESMQAIYRPEDRVHRTTDRLRGTVVAGAPPDASVILVRWDDFPSEPMPCGVEDVAPERRPCRSAPVPERRGYRPRPLER